MSIAQRANYRHGDLRQALLDAGLDMARAGGPDAVVLREATRRAGVSPNAAYRHFADRDALLGAVCETGMGMFVEQMDHAVAAVAVLPAPQDTATARLGAVGRTYLSFARGEQGLFDTIFTTPEFVSFQDGRPRAGTADRTPFHVLGEVLDGLVAAGVMPAQRRPGAEFAVWSCVHGMAMLRNHGPLRSLPQENADTAVDALYAFILRGL